MKIKTANLESYALNWAVLKCLYPDTDCGAYWIEQASQMDFSRDWSLAGPLIEKERILVSPGPLWSARSFLNLGCSGSGATPLVAAMRCLVVFKLGTEVEIPDSLYNQ